MTFGVFSLYFSTLEFKNTNLQKIEFQEEIKD